MNPETIQQEENVSAIEVVPVAQSEYFEINKKLHIEHVVSTDETRFLLCNISIKGNKAYATNGRIAVIAPIFSTGEACDGLLSVKALKAARKASPKSSDVAHLDCTKKRATDADGVSFPRPLIAFPFPNVEKVIPSDGENYKFKITINPEMLMRIAKAIGGAESVTLAFKDSESAVVVTTAKTDALGVLMPMRMDEKSDTANLGN